MNWVKLAVDLAREAMSMDATRRAQNAQKQPDKPDLAEALAQQFAAIDGNIETVVASVNAQNMKLENALRRQKIWNYALLAGIVAALGVAVFR